MQFVLPHKVAAFHRYQRMRVSIVDFLFNYHNSFLLVNTFLEFRGMLPYDTFSISNLTPKFGLDFYKYTFSLKKNESHRILFLILFSFLKINKNKW